MILDFEWRIYRSTFYKNLQNEATIAGPKELVAVAVPLDKTRGEKEHTGHHYTRKLIPLASTIAAS